MKASDVITLFPRPDAKPDMPRFTGCHTYKSAHTPQVMSPDKAEHLYRKLKPFLRITSSWGMYLPMRPHQKGRPPTELQLHEWPLAYRCKENNFWPTPVTWAPRARGRTLSFKEFLTAYQISLTKL